MRQRLLDWGLLLLATVFSVLLVWVPFFFNLEEIWTIPLDRRGMEPIYSNYDGPYYLVVAETLYEPELVQQYEFPLPNEYWAAHYPLYPLLIRPLSMIMAPVHAMLVVTVLSSVLAVIAFYEIVKGLGIKQPLWIALIYLVLPARWLVVRAVGSPEPLFIFLTLMSIWSFYKEKYWSAGIWGALAQLTKPPGILLFGAFGLAILARELPKISHMSAWKWFKQLPWRAVPISLIPLALLGLWFWYSTIYGSFLAYFESGDNIHLFWPPFQMFNREAFWVGTFWLEDIIWILLIAGMGVALLWKRNDIFSWYGITFLGSLLFVSHRDFSRYALPLMPILLIAYAPYLRKEFKYVMLLLIIPIYLYAINFISANTTPISNWSYFI